jgi:hypothetical protein
MVVAVASRDGGVVNHNVAAPPDDAGEDGD